MDDYRYIESEDYYEMACQWIKHKNFDKAEDCLLRSVSLNPHFTYAYITLARIYARKEKFHDAIHVLKKASKNDPGFDRINFLMAKYAFKNHDYRNALKFIDRAIEINPTELYESARGIIMDWFRSMNR